MLLSPAVKTSYLNTMAGGSSPTPKRRMEGEETAETSPLSGKRARPTMPLRGSRSAASLHFQQQAPVHPPMSVRSMSEFAQDPFASSSDITLDDLSAPQQQNLQRDIFTHSSATSNKGKGAEAVPSSVFTSNNPHWLKVVTSYGYTFIKSDELHLLEGNADVQMVIESNQNEVPRSPPAQMRYPMGLEFPPTPSPSDDGNGTPAHRYFAQQHAGGKPLWEHVEGDREAARAQAQAAAGGINEMMMDEW